MRYYLFQCAKPLLALLLLLFGGYIQAQDTVPPIAVCQDITVTLPQSGLAGVSATLADDGSSDNSGNFTLSLSQNIFVLSDVGDVLDTLIVTDAAGNVSTCEFTATVLPPPDIIPPVVTCPPNMVVNTDPGVCGAIVEFEIIATDNTGGPVTVISTFESGDFFEGIFINEFVSVLATDEAGNQSTCEFSVLVQDTVPPTVTCPTDITVNASSVGCEATNVNLGVATATDNCFIADTIANDAPSAFPLGVTVVTYSVGDFTTFFPELPDNSLGTCTQTVTVVDDVPPVAICQDITVELGNFGAQPVVITPSEIDNGSSDNCVGVSLSASQTAFTFFDAGDNLVTLTATDLSGNTSTCVSTVTVEIPIDSIPPVAVCQDVTVTLDSTGFAQVSPPEINNGSSDNSGGFGLVLSQLTFGFADIGDVPITLTITDSQGNTDVCSSIVTVLPPVDNIPPVITCPADTVLFSEPDTCGVIVDFEFTATDNLGGPITFTSTRQSGDFFGAGFITESIAAFATDVSGNISSECSFSIQVLDTIPPTITCPVDITVGTSTVGCEATNVNLGEATATDNCAILDDIENDAPNIFPLGETLITYSVADFTIAFPNVPDSRLGTCTQTVTVVDDVPPVAICQDITVELGNFGSQPVTITASDIDNGSSDICGAVSLSASETFFNSSDEGDNEVTLTVTDLAGNTSTCVSTVTVEIPVDTIPPVAVCRDITVTLSQSGIAELEPFLVNNGSTDNAGNILLSGLSLSQSVFDVSDVGDVLDTLIVTDAAGNVGTCEFTVTVLPIPDETPPEIICPADMTLFSDFNVCGTILEFEVTVTDNSGGPITIQSSRMNGEFIDVAGFAEPVFVTAIDSSGNRAECFFTVEVFDTIPPTVTCPADITVAATTAGCEATNVNLGVATAIDVCTSLFSLTIENDAPSIFPLGETIVTHSIPDLFGNIGTCTQKVTVVDTVPPVAICQDITVELDISGNGTTVITPSDIDNGSSDVCGAVTLAASQIAFSSTDIGDNSVTLTITDLAGNTSTCVSTVTILPAPGSGTAEITCPADLNLTFGGSGAQDVAIQAWLDSASAIDVFGASDLVTNDFDATAFDQCEDFGTQTVTFTSASGETCTAIVTVTFVEPACEVEDFESLNTGDIVSNQLPGVTVSATSQNNSGNLAMIFDTANPTGGDNDLSSVVHGMVLIISEDLDSSDPDDEADGGIITFDFDTPQYVGTMGFLDIENPWSTVSLFDANGALIQTLNIPNTGDGGSAEVIINTEDVSKIEVDLMTSGAVTDFCSFDQDLIPSCVDIGCRTTPECETEDFEAFLSGDIIDTQIPGTTVFGFSNDFTGSNAAMIFDSENPTGGDNDLSTNNEGMILILTEDGDSSDPDDAANGGTLEFVFDTPQFIDHVTLLDIQTNHATISLFSSNGGLIDEISVPNGGNGNLVDVPVGIDDVARMEVYFPNSGAVVDFCKYESGALVVCPPAPAVTCGVQVLYSDFEGSANGGYGVWTDGGSDSNHSAFGSPEVIDTYGVRLRDNSSSSNITSEEYDLSSFQSLTLDFTYYTLGVENGEEFFFEISQDGGSSYSIVETWERGPDFNNNSREYDVVNISGPFTDEVRFRFRTDMSHNNDRVFLDNILIDGCTTGGIAPKVAAPQGNILTVNPTGINQGSNDLLEVFPNPVTNTLNVIMGVEDNIDFEILHINGAVIRTGTSSGVIDVQKLESGTYFIRATDGRVARFIKI